ncbi:hypothetical protein N7454_001069 [Penicillium verhagenii]|nr:hypothetical protein N7454_001069 [Penicillium verhagenii]
MAKPCIKSRHGVSDAIANYTMSGLLDNPTDLLPLEDQPFRLPIPDLENPENHRVAHVITRAIRKWNADAP